MSRSPTTRRPHRLHRLHLAGVAMFSTLSFAGVAAATMPPAPPPAPPPTTPPATAAGPLRILVTNDDGLKGVGLDVLVEALRALPDVEVTVIAPANNQSGTGNRTTPGPLLVVDSTTLSGYPGKAVGGFPADTIVWALDQGGYDGRPDVVVSGINAGQNIGWVANELSGTVGAARAAAVRGVPAIAASQGLPAEGQDFDFATGAAQVVDWITAHRAELDAGDPDTPIPFTNMNIPSCATGTTVRGVVDVPGGTVDDGRQVLAPADCASTTPAPADDVAAFNTGFVAISELPAPVPTSPDTAPPATQPLVGTMPAGQS